MAVFAEKIGGYDELRGFPFLFTIRDFVCQLVNNPGYLAKIV